MKRKSIDLDKDPTRGFVGLQGNGTPAIYCDAVRVDLPSYSHLYVSGKTGIDGSNKLVGRTMEEQTDQILRNIQAVLEHEGGTMDDIVRLRVFVTQLDSQSLEDIHRVRARYFTKGKYPASTLVRVAQLIRDGALIEINSEAVLPTR